MLQNADRQKIYSDFCMSINPIFRVLKPSNLHTRFYVFEIHFRRFRPYMICTRSNCNCMDLFR